MRSAQRTSGSAREPDSRKTTSSVNALDFLNASVPPLDERQIAATQSDDVQVGNVAAQHES